jgi:LysR family transcriptional activator of dmlA
MHLPDIDDLNFFEKVSHSRSLTEAARDWGVSVSAVSKRLTGLEARLGVQLIRRTTRRLSLTDEGMRYAAGATSIVAAVADLEDSIAESQGPLRGSIAVHSTLGLGRKHIAPLLADFVGVNPEVKVELELSHLPLNIAETPFDIGIRVGHLQDSRLKARRLQRNTRIVCAAPSYLRDHGAPATPQELGEHNCIILHENESDYALWRFGTDSHEFAVRVDGNMMSNDGDVATLWCIEGRGLIMRSQWHVAPMIADGTLVQVLADILTPSADIHAVYRSTAHVPRRINSMLDYLQAGLSTRIKAML